MEHLRRAGLRRRQLAPTGRSARFLSEQLLPLRCATTPIVEVAAEERRARTLWDEYERSRPRPTRNFAMRQASDAASRSIPVFRELFKQGGRQHERQTMHAARTVMPQPAPTGTSS